MSWALIIATYAWSIVIPMHTEQACLEAAQKAKAELAIVRPVHTSCVPTHKGAK